MIIISIFVSYFFFRNDFENFDKNQLPEELTLDYAEITSIPPLPLWTLLAADRELSQSAQVAEEKKVRI